jgi:peptidoglycan/LPS O-acetylase OafA/YrhL
MANQAAPRRHVRELDLLRALTVLGVISVHTIWFTNLSTDLSANLGMDMLHFTRNVFMFMTAFVLFYVYFRRSYRLSTFWGRRFKLVGIPYVLWSMYYVYYGGAFHHGVGFYLSTLASDLVQGTAWFHLYYLLVTMQFYLVFPLFVWLVRKTAGHHRWLLLASLGLELAMMTVFQYAPGWMTTGVGQPWLWLIENRHQVVFTYQFYLILGAVTAVHLDQIEAYIRTHGRTIGLGLLTSAVAMAAYYALAVFVWSEPLTFATNVFQPLMPIYSLCVIFSMYRLGQRWVGAMSQDRWRAATWAIVWVADLSFGIYLIHPAVLEELTTRYLFMLGPFTRVIITPVASLLTLTLSALIVRIMAATPWSVYMIGREQVPMAFDRWRRYLPQRPVRRTPAAGEAEGGPLPTFAEGGAR